jgi:hypothetical protein
VTTHGMHLPVRSLLWPFLPIWGAFWPSGACWPQCPVLHTPTTTTAPHHDLLLLFCRAHLRVLWRHHDVLRQCLFHRRVLRAPLQGLQASQGPGGAGGRQGLADLKKRLPGLHRPSRVSFTGWLVCTSPPPSLSLSLSLSLLSPSTALYIPIDGSGDYFSTSRMCSTSCTSGLYLQVWRWVGRYAVGGLVRVVRSFSRPARPQKRLGKAQTPTRLAD